MSKGKLVVITGPSGVGKDTIVRLFTKKHPDWHELPSVTSRPPRPGEREGVDYFFVDRKIFQKKAKADDFLEWEETTGNLYGTPKEPVQKALNAGGRIIFRKDVRGALSIKRSLPQAVTICLLPDEWEALEKRFRGRATDSEELTLARLELAKEELQYKEHFDYIVINPHNRSQEALVEIEKIVEV